ncbi:flavin-containing monooxygenase [Hymenobacter jejuensis]|uniref:FAD-dependent oxidoreductase n=1 Tax=Hymenobacter jejuensis TaxID=2502781 RepID=A0A5B8A1A6_9BACT|nr:NAD(P)/FAD-dependent oxidoreductase [Hymenobacter jejuensis]QDA60505.1 FAD-dependent oxidoreductase [Hymenobacter jejuensis]
MPIETFHTVVIGAGQAGLAAAYYLQQHGVSFVVLDERETVGDVWATRFDALQLFSPPWASNLPGLSWPPGSPLRYPSKAEAAQYLQQYAAHFKLPVRLRQRVTRLLVTSDSSEGFQIYTSDNQTYICKNAIICTGAYTAPHMPMFAAELAPTVVQLHSQAYRRPSQLLGIEAVAVVGSGNSALQIAADVAATGRPVFVAYDENTPTLPNNNLMWALLKITGMMNVSRHTALGRRMLSRPDPVVSSDLTRLRQFSNAQFIGRALGVANETRLHGRQATTPPLEAVVWATGYAPDYNWIEAPIFDAQGSPKHYRGLASVPGLAFLGLPWLNSRSSALMGGAGRDARYVVEQLLKRP